MQYLYLIGLDRQLDTHLYRTVQAVTVHSVRRRLGTGYRAVHTVTVLLRTATVTPVLTVMITISGRKKTVGLQIQN